jgi:hypothetical protein
MIIFPAVTVAFTFSGTPATTATTSSGNVVTTTTSKTTNRLASDLFPLWNAAKLKKKKVS